MSAAFEGSKNILIWFSNQKKVTVNCLPISKYMTGRKQKTKTGWWQQQI